MKKVSIGISFVAKPAVQVLKLFSPFHFSPRGTISESSDHFFSKSRKLCSTAEKLIVSTSTTVASIILKSSSNAMVSKPVSINGT